jgi:hypothetical protein
MANNFEEGQGSQRAVVPVIIIIINIVVVVVVVIIIKFVEIIFSQRFLAGRKKPAKETSAILINLLFENEHDIKQYC